jgi:hypothetical protein
VGDVMPSPEETAEGAFTNLTARTLSITKRSERIRAIVNFVLFMDLKDTEIKTSY